MRLKKVLPYGFHSVTIPSQFKERRLHGMEDRNRIQAGLNGLGDMVDVVERKLYNIAGLLELVCMGIESLDHENDSYELSSLNVVRDYVSDMNKTDISGIHVMLSELKKEV